MKPSPSAASAASSEERNRSVSLPNVGYPSKSYASGQSACACYRIRIEALGQQLEEPLTIVPNQTTRISLGVEGERFVVRH